MTHSYNAKNALVVRSITDLRDWLETNGEREAGIWIVSFKKQHEYFVPYGGIRDEALCFGWVDSKSQAVDEKRTATWLSPRRGGSPWSGVNKKQVAALRHAGRITALGEKAIARAKKDGSWSILDDASALVVPEELARALKSKGVCNIYAGLSPSKRRSMLEGIALAKTDRTRRARIQRIVEQCRLSGD